MLQMLMEAHLQAALLVVRAPLQSSLCLLPLQLLQLLLRGVLLFGLRLACGMNAGASGMLHRAMTT